MHPTPIDHAVAYAAGLGAAVMLVKFAAEKQAEGKTALAEALVTRLPAEHRELLEQFQLAGANLAARAA